MQLQECADMWKRADAILEHATTPNARFFGLSILEVGTVAAASQSDK